MYNNLAEIERQGRIVFRPSSVEDILASFQIEIDGERITADEFLQAETTRLNK